MGSRLAAAQEPALARGALSAKENCWVGYSGSLSANANQYGRIRVAHHRRPVNTLTH